MSTLFFWTGAVVWGTLAAAFAVVVLAFVVQYGLSTLNVCAQLYWVKRSRTKRNDVSLWSIVVQDAHMMGPSKLIAEIRKYIHWGNIRYKQPENIGYMRLKNKTN